MTNYSKLNSGQGPTPHLISALINAWLDDYRHRGASNDIVETSAANFSYLFDIGRGRLIAAWGISHGKHTGARDKSRMAGHPLGAAAGYHRGHAIPHTLGGPTDINLVPQLGSVNVGPFRKLEKEAVATPGALYFTYWLYPPGDSQKPTGVEQGLLVPGQSLRVSRHAN
jgi:hypothetical protein